ncbi:hypothetical protein MKW98_013894 [Papaver atlanticum]|uniref:Uncharacterized protein n=1 Tax=Papaver atlanticum TaxID=357466 RepID=A0AAD4SDK1_9MAGN|nr:hypothetical protein MKW98_013894 [Papaver atlanticum]
MVAISLYRGNLHKAPDAPRKWLMPRRNISLKDFRILSHKRDRTLSSIVASTKITSPPITTIVSVPNPNPNLQQGEGVGDSGGSKNKLDSATETCSLPQLEQEIVNLIEGKEEEGQQQHLPTKGKEDYSEFQIELDIDGGGTCNEQQQPEEVEDDCILTVDEITELLLEADSGGLENVAPAVVDGTSQEVLVVSDQPPVNVCENVDLPYEKEKKKKELEEKLEVLNGRKHNLVQMLKQILNAEEEMKRRNNVLASVIRPPAPLQVETSDLRSPGQAVTRTGLDANHCGDLEGESEDHSPHNVHIRNFQRMRSTSPSGSSPFRKSSHSSLQPNTVLCPPRTSGIIASPSPSRFAPSGSAHPANPPPAPISVSGTQFMTSSPSPAASGGTSVFRDSRFTSPS